MTKGLKLTIDVLKKFHCGFSKLVKLRLEQVVKNINGWETWNGVTFVHHDSLLNGHVGVGLGSWATLVLSVQLVELHLDLCTTRKLGLLRHVATSAHLSSCIILTCDLILISLNKLSYHIPQKMLLLAILRGKGWAKVDEISLGLT